MGFLYPSKTETGTRYDNNHSPHQANLLSMHEKNQVGNAGFNLYHYK